MGGRGASSGMKKAKVTVMSEGQFLARRGVSDPVSDFTVDKMRGNNMLKTEKGQRRFEKQHEEAMNAYYEKRNKAKEEFRQLVKEGKLREPTSLERRLQTAKGHPDNQATQSARRILRKMGIDWKTGKKIR